MVPFAQWDSFTSFPVCVPLFDFLAVFLSRPLAQCWLAVWKVEPLPFCCQRIESFILRYRVRSGLSNAFCQVEQVPPPQLVGCFLLWEGTDFVNYTLLAIPWVLICFCFVFMDLKVLKVLLVVYFLSHGYLGLWCLFLTFMNFPNFLLIFKFHSIVLREYSLYDFSTSEVIKYYFMASCVRP
jgi:hypothetical protein